MFIVRSLWSGFPGSPGYTNFAYDTTDGSAATTAQVDAALGKVKFLWDHINFSLPTSVTIQVEQEVRVINPTTGALTGLQNGSAAPAPTVGMGPSNVFSGASGAVIEWATGTVAAGRLVRGRTFIVPLCTDAYDSGSLKPTYYGPIATNAATMYDGSGGVGLNFGVWSRPAKSRTKKDGTVVPARAGVFAPITGSKVPDLAAILRSRRD